MKHQLRDGRSVTGAETSATRNETLVTDEKASATGDETSVMVMEHQSLVTKSQQILMKP